MKAYIEIPGITRVAIRINYGLYQRMETVAYQTLHTRGLVTTRNRQHDIQVVREAIEQTIQDLIDAAFMTNNPEQFLELLRENVEKAYGKRRGNLLAL
ncbi:hypothetical protein LCGC14_2762730 [marine sediment metagenome]|uniref:Uncharacterized protein n=1 Tax=marine sediment metagenome TaxID=412755 RepID=A0A0F9B748_9ZZZZ|nr:hypothetical protein [bacterium]